MQYIKCSINYPSSSLLWCKYRIIRQLIKHRLKSLYIYCIWKRISWTLLRLVLDKFTANANTTRRHILQPLTELSHLFLPTVPFLSGHKIPLVSREPYSTLSRQPKIGRKIMLYDTGLALMFGINHLKGGKKMWLNLNFINFQ